ncbi:major capsid protein [Peromfec virus RodF5_12]|uniref:Major capsid protein n=1 Tax=Peromfec virus RodF5_12 TaxID=2929336 RepID=A0A976N2J2_9VIRU|nr:major capsid protein [Peromfec virus RodF5_12]
MKRSRFDLSYPVQATFDAGYLVPFYLQDTLPNDTFYISQKSFIRANPMTAPLLHDVDVFLQYWYCPERILWEDTEDFFLGLSEQAGNPSPVRPYIVAPEGGFAVGSLADYFGFPTGQAGIKVSALPFRAYALAYNLKYRHQLYMPEVSIAVSSGLDTETNLALLSPRWRSDYFMQAEDAPQLGEQIMVPVTGGNNSEQYIQYQFQVGYVDGNGNVVSNSNSGAVTSQPPACPTSVTQDIIRGYINDNLPKLLDAPLHQRFVIVSGVDYSSTQNPGLTSVDVVITKTNQLVKDFKPGDVNETFIQEATYSCRVYQGSGTLVKPWHKDISFGQVVYNGKILENTASISLRSLSRASHMQRYQERMLKTQNKYPKFIKNNFGFDIRSDIIDEPQYLGGSRGQILFDAVLQTSEGENGGVGSLYGRGVGRTKQRPIKFRCPEHGLIIGLLSIRPRFVYSQGIERAWSRESRFDFFLPDFTDIGMQEIMQKELFATADNEHVPFGFTPRYQEYRERFPKICGQFRTIFSDWNMALKFDAPPSLVGDFLSMSSGVDGFKRPFAVPAEHSYLGYLYNRVTAVRPVPKYAKRTQI